MIHRVKIGGIILATDEHVFENQARRMFEQHASKAARKLGLASGDKYSTKLKSTETYTPK